MLFWRDLSAACALTRRRAGPPQKRGRAGGHRLSVHAEAVTAILSN